MSEQRCWNCLSSELKPSQLQVWDIPRLMLLRRPARCQFCLQRQTVPAAPEWIRRTLIVGMFLAGYVLSAGPVDLLHELGAIPLSVYALFNDVIYYPAERLLGGTPDRGSDGLFDRYRRLWIRSSDFEEAPVRGKSSSGGEALVTDPQSRVAARSHLQAKSPSLSLVVYAQSRGMARSWVAVAPAALAALDDL